MPRNPNPFASWTPQGFVTDVWQQFLIDEFQDQTGIRVPTAPSPGGTVGSAIHDHLRTAFPGQVGVPNQTFRAMLGTSAFARPRASPQDIMWMRLMAAARRDRVMAARGGRRSSFGPMWAEWQGRHTGVLCDVLPPTQALEAADRRGRAAMPDFGMEDPVSVSERAFLAMALINAFLCFLLVFRSMEITMVPASSRNAEAYRTAFANFFRNVVETVPTLPADQVRRLVAELRRCMNQSMLAP